MEMTAVLMAPRQVQETLAKKTSSMPVGAKLEDFNFVYTVERKPPPRYEPMADATLHAQRYECKGRHEEPKRPVVFGQHDDGFWGLVGPRLRAHEGTKHRLAHTIRMDAPTEPKVCGRSQQKAAIKLTCTRCGAAAASDLCSVFMIEPCPVEWKAESQAAGLAEAKGVVAAMTPAQRSLLEKLRAARAHNLWMNLEPHQAHFPQPQAAARRGRRTTPRVVAQTAAASRSVLLDPLEEDDDDDDEDERHQDDERGRSPTREGNPRRTAPGRRPRKRPRRFVSQQAGQPDDEREVEMQEEDKEPTRLDARRRRLPKRRADGTREKLYSNVSYLGLATARPPGEEAEEEVLTVP